MVYFVFANTVVAVSQSQNETKQEPVKAELLSTWKGKPPLKFYSIRLSLFNKEKVPVWFILPYFADRPLSARGVFMLDDWRGAAFGGTRFKGQGGSAIEIVMHGLNFRAFLLPAKGKLHLNGYTIKVSMEDVNELKIMEARKLNINGKIALEAWLPYSPLNGNNVIVDSMGFSLPENLDWGKFDRDPHIGERVKFVKAEGIKIWSVKLLPSR
jgi:hypothetical protein